MKSSVSFETQVHTHARVRYTNKKCIYIFLFYERKCKNLQLGSKKSELVAGFPFFSRYFQSVVYFYISVRLLLKQNQIFFHTVGNLFREKLRFIKNVDIKLYS